MYQIIFSFYIACGRYRLAELLINLALQIRCLMEFDLIDFSYFKLGKVILIRLQYY